MRNNDIFAAMSKPLILRVAVPSPLRRLFDYLWSEQASPALPSSAKPVLGGRVRVPFGNRTLVGVVIEITDKSDLPTEKIKAVRELIDTEALFPEALFNTLIWAANYYHHPIGEVFALALPQVLRSGKPLHKPISVVQLGTLAKSQIETGQQIVSNRAKKQQKLLEFLHANGPSHLAHVKEQGFSPALINGLVKLKHIIIKQQTLGAEPAAAAPREVGINNQHALELSPEQKSALNKISQKREGFSCFLLQGVTGSGKTEVYMQALAPHLEAGRQALILVPEIGLTPQLLERFKARFDCAISVLHSGMTANERFEAWRCARSGDSKIVIGTRSAVFTPLKRPGVIIVDEEHDASFKQQDSFRYSARDLANVRAMNENIPIILGSATPSFESLVNANQKKYQVLHLKNRAGAAAQPIIKLLDVSNEDLTHGLAQESLQTIEQHLLADNQVLVYINRRGYAPTLLCQHCGWLAECNRCDTQLILHRTPPGLRCHHCSSNKPIPDHCPSCHRKDLTTRGSGTQKTEQALEARLPQWPIIRIDRDSSRNQKAFKSLLQPIHEGHPCVLVGTQMLAKGHHFPRITLVVILDADGGLFSADFRGQEFMAQSLLQVAGRSGRAAIPGEVIVQSRHVDHSTLLNLVDNDYDKLAAPLLQERREGAMPPFSSLAIFRAEAVSAQHPMVFLHQLAQLAKGFNHEVAIHGPLPAPMERRQGRFRFQLHFRSKQRQRLQGFLTQLLQEFESSKELQKQSRKLRWSLDIDPLDLL